MKKTRKLRAFSLLEMLVVIMIIAALLLLFVPKLSEQRDYAVKQSNFALVKVVNEQYEMYRMENQSLGQAGNRLTEEQLNALTNAGFLTQAQADKYKELPDDAFK